LEELQDFELACETRIKETRQKLEKGYITLRQEFEKKHAEHLENLKQKQKYELLQTKILAIQETRELQLKFQNKKTLLTRKFKSNFEGAVKICIKEILS